MLTVRVPAVRGLLLSYRMRGILAVLSSQMIILFNNLLPLCNLHLLLSTKLFLMMDLMMDSCVILTLLVCLKMFLYHL